MNPAWLAPVALVLAACSQGTPSSGAAPGTGTTATAYEQRVLELTNQARAQARACGTKSFAAAPSVTFNANLRTAAYRHSKDMADRNYFSHTNPDGLNPFQRMQNAGYTNYRAAAENIAAGQTTPEQVMDGWLKSPGHCENIMNPNLRELGVGYHRGGSYGHYWTQNFGTR